MAALVVGVLLAAVLTLPWWWGMALRQAGEGYGLTFGTYERIGYLRWALRDVAWKSDGAVFLINRIEAPHPLHWAISGGESGPLLGGEWSFELAPGREEEMAEPEADAGWRQFRVQLADLHDTLVQWLPEAEFGSGSIHWPDGSIRVDSVQWTRDQLRVNGIGYREMMADAVVAWPEHRSDPVVAAADAGGEWRLSAVAGEERAEGQVVWYGQPAKFSATFPRTGWIPAEADVLADEWELPGGALKLGEYYSEVRGGLAFEWRGDRGAVRLAATGEPQEGRPPLRVRLKAEGDPARLTVQELEVQAPGLEAVLDEPARLDPRRVSTETPAVFRLDADLAEIPHVPGAGRVAGRVRVEPRRGAWPRLRANLRLEDVSVEEWAEGVQGEMTASFEWPELVVQSATVSDAAGTAFRARGEADLAKRMIRSAELSGRLSARSVSRWLPKAIAFETAEVKASGSGAIEALQHEGRVRAEGVKIEGFHPIAAGIGWSGRGRDLEARVAAETANGFARVVADAGETVVHIRELQVLHGGDEAFVLVEPVRVQLSPDLRIGAIRLAGPSAELAVELDMSPEERLALEMPHLSLGWVSDWWLEPVPVARLRDVQLNATIPDGTLNFQLAGDVELAPVEGTMIAFRVRASGDEAGLRIEQLIGLAEGEPVVRISGDLPIAIHPRRSPAWEVDEDAPVAIAAQVEPRPDLWDDLARRAGMVVENPRLHADLRGTWNAPRGAVRLEVARIERADGSNGAALPVLTDLELMLRGDGEHLMLENLSAKVEGQPLRASGRLPLARDVWDSVQEAPFEYLRKHGEGRIELPPADLAAFSRLVPDVLAPTGQVQARLEFGPDGGVRGALQLRDAASRPLGPLGVLQDITAELSFQDREIRIGALQARMGGQPVTLSGSASLPETGSPQLDLRLRGENLPLVRQVGILLRADLDLGLMTDPSGDGRVTGEVRLRDGLFLADLQDIVPRGGGGNRPAARPPYFSVNVRPLNRWTLDVAVEGEQFLRLRTPLLQGLASARFRLEGTLADPRALGEAVVEEGQIRLPFATFSIEEGTVRLTRAEPHQPQLSLIGTSRRLGYDLRMEVTGPASDPRLQFFSSPPLSSEEILLLVMAGQAPQDEIAYSGRQRAVQIGTFLGRGLIDDVFGGGGGDSKLTVTSGERVSRQGRETYRFTYELTPRLSLVGEYDEFDSYNAGLRWRLLPRKDQPEEEDADDAPTS